MGKYPKASQGHVSHLDKAMLFLMVVSIAIGLFINI